MTNLEIDKISRNRIVAEPGSNFFVEAGAGSGKTTMLTRRMVAMVEAGMDISKICAITFTKAAAGEFYERFQKLLIERSNPAYKWKDEGHAGQLPKPTELTRTRCEEALKNIDMCFMGTIDSFCSMVLSEHPSEAGIPSDSKIMNEDEQIRFLRRMYIEIGDGKHGTDLAEKAHIFRRVNSKNEEAFVNCERELIGSRNIEYIYNETGADVDDNPDVYFSAEKNQLSLVLSFLQASPHLKYSKYNEKNEKAWSDLPTIAARLAGSWKRDFIGITNALSALKEIRLIPKAEIPGMYQDFFTHGGSEKAGWEKFDASIITRKFKEYSYLISMKFLLDSVPVLEKVMRERGILTYFDYLYYLRNMLKKDAAGDGKLIRYIYDRHSYFMIDEFQDTNPMQAEVFFYLASENPSEKWSECVPRPGSLFIVGDPKQSIYRFRGADVSSFLRVKKLFQKQCGDILYLSSNFRSTNTVLTYFNRVFAKLLPEETELQSKFEEIPIRDTEKKAFKGIYKFTALIEGDGKYYPGGSADSIAKIIKKLVNNPNFLLDEDTENPKKLTYNDIMVITSTKYPIPTIMEVFKRENIPMRVEGAVAFDRNQALLEIGNIYRAIAYPDNNMYLYNALVGLLCNISQEELLKFRLSAEAQNKEQDKLQLLRISLKDKYDFSKEKNKTVLKVANGILKMQELLKKAQRLSPAALFEEIMDSYEVYRVAEAENLEVIYYTLELLRSAEKNGTISTIAEAAEYINTLLAGKSKEERCLSLGESDRVHVANLHKVKGLEATVVILAAAGKHSPTPRIRVVHGEDKSVGYIFKMAPKGVFSYTYLETEAFGSELADEGEAEMAEQKRMIYVAATRARNALIVCDSIQEKGNERNNQWDSLIESTTPDFFETFKDIPDGEVVAQKEVKVGKLYEQAAKSCVLNDRSAESTSYEIKTPSKLKVKSKLDEETDETGSAVSNVAADIDDEATANAKSDVAVDEDPAGDSVEEDSREDSIEDAAQDGVTGTSATPKLRKARDVLGTMVHRMMEVLVLSRNSVDTDALIEQILAEYRKPVNMKYESYFAEALKSVARIVRNGGYDQVNKAPKDILTTLLEADEVYCEVPFCLKDETDENKVIWNGIIDVMYCKDDKWHIIDYKTNIDGSNLDSEYKGQLEAYKKALRVNTGIEADAMIYHIDV